MEVSVAPGKYIVAVSGGVDSVFLLHLLVSQPQLELVVAHFNHGMRQSADNDETFVRGLVEKFGLDFESAKGNLGSDASENDARRERYKFLRDIRDKHEAAGIITAHHQDDLIETALINLSRGTGSRGMVAILNNPEIIRPLINTPKSEILEYAHKQNIQWVEDESNQDPRYLRNGLRQMLADRLSEQDRQQLLNHINSINRVQDEKDELLDILGGHVFEDAQTIRRSSFIFLPDDVASEIILHWLRQNNVLADRPLVNRLSIAIKTGRANSAHSVDKGHTLRLSAQKAHLTSIS